MNTRSHVNRPGLAERIFRVAVVSVLCLAGGLVLGQSGYDRSTHVLLKKRDTINSIPKEYGRLAGVERTSDSTVLYFEAQDGTIRMVSVIYGIDHGSLTFRTITVPRT